MSSNLHWIIAARTDTGRQRAANEDAYAVLDVARQKLRADAAFVIADGMGGMQSGDVASREAVRVVAETLSRCLADPQGDPQAALDEALRGANRAVHALAAGPPPGEEDTPRDRGSKRTAADPPGLMGTTCVAGVVRQGRLYLAHAGDSRAYVVRGGRLVRLTRDHSFVEERVRAGELTEEDARRSRYRNVITRAIGIEPEVEPELGEETLEPDDLLLLCTDGLTTMLPDAEIETVLSRPESGKTNRGANAILEDTANALVDAANRRGGADNITVLLARAGSPQAVPSPGKPAAPSRAAGVVDLDAPPVRAGRSPRRPLAPLMGLLALIGLAALGLAGALAVFPDLRARADTLLGAPAKDSGRPTDGITPPPPLVPDLSRAVYGKPEPFGAFLARGDVLQYSPQGGLYFVGSASGKIAALGRAGEVLRMRPLVTLPSAPPPPTPIPASRTFFATDAQGNGYVSYTARKIIQKYDREGRLLLTIGGLQQPEALAVDEDGNLYVVDYNQIKKLLVRFPAKPDKGKP